MLKFALYVSNHGFGHSTRISALAEELIHYGVFCHIITTKPAFLFQDLNPHYFVLHNRAIDVGVKHSENLTVDIKRTINSLLELLSKRNEIMEREIEFLRREKIDCIIADIPFLVSDFAAYCHIPVFAVTNFEWHFIYSSLLVEEENTEKENGIVNNYNNLELSRRAASSGYTNFSTPEVANSLKPVLNLIWSLYQRFDGCFRLPFSTDESMSAFKDYISCGLLSRKKDKYKDIRLQYNLPKETPILLVMFGGEGTMELNYEALCSAYQGIVISTQAGIKAKNHIQVSMDDDFPDFISNADIILCKPGYSTLAEAVQAGKFIIYCPRLNYPEEKALIAGLKHYANCLQIDTLQLSAGQWKAIFEDIKPRKIRTKTYKNCNTEVAGLVLKKYTQLQNRRLLSVFDLGSNNLNYVLFDLEKRQIVHQTQLTTALGVAFKHNKISEKRLTSVKQIISKLLQLDSYLESEKVLLATGVMRFALNANLLTDWITDKYNIKCKIISSQEEIRYAYFSARQYKSGEEATLAIDIGGFSTEFINLDKEKKQQGNSLPFGLLTLLNDFNGDSETADNFIRQKLNDLPYKGSYRLVGIGLTYTYLAGVIFRCSYNEREKLEGKAITKKQLQELSHSLEVRDEQRYLPFLLEESYLPILKLSIAFNISLLDRFETSEIIVCNSGIAVGYAYWYSSKQRSKAQK